MNLLTDNWIPVRPQQMGTSQQISLQALLCGSDRWELSLPRDDMELAALQLLICIAQVLFPPVGKKEWGERIAEPLPLDVFADAIENYQDWFQLDHAMYPFMQVKGVEAKNVTSMDKLLAGLDSSTNGRFVNEPNLANGLCFGCAAIALYNQANNAPSFCGGVKAGLRGPSPVTTFSRFPTENFCLKETIFVNLLSKEFIKENFEKLASDKTQPPNWRLPIKQVGVKNKIKQGEPVLVSDVSLFKGLFWQPAHIELVRSEFAYTCSCCGLSVASFSSLIFEKFSYEYVGAWIHPHSPQIFSIKKGEVQIKYLSFTPSTPSWTQLSNYLVTCGLSQERKGEFGQTPALVVKQIQEYLKEKSENTELIVGGYCNNKASILERRHEVFTLSHGWEAHAGKVRELVEHAQKYKDALIGQLYYISKDTEGEKGNLKKIGLSFKKNKKTYHALVERGIKQFYRRSEDLMMQSLASIDFNNTLPTYVELDAQFNTICKSIFTELTNPYQHDPELFRTLTIARRSLQKHIREIRVNQPSEDAA